MAGTVTNKTQVLPVPAGTSVPAAAITGTGDVGLDQTVAPYTFLKDQSNPGASVPLLGLAQEGTDSTAAGATQATGGLGIRGWLSTLVSLFRSGAATVSVGNTPSVTVGNTPSVTVSGTPSVTVSGTPLVTVSGTPTVSVSALPGSPAQDGTDSSATTALQATAGVGLRGWLSTLVSLQRAATGTLSSVTASTVSQSLVAANAARKGLLVVNDSSAALYVAYAATASTTAYTAYIPGSTASGPNYWEAPAPVYTGALSGVWATATGAARITELT